MTVSLITASAGTGKTYRLVEEIAAALLAKDDPLEPETLLAVTFTRKAAAELEERLRRRLMSAGRVDLARRLGAARIGTVNAVCQRLVEDYAFELGLSPDLRTLDEPLAEHVLSDVLAELLSGDEVGAVDDLARRMPEMRNFSRLTKPLIDMARAYGLDADGLRAAAHRSRERLLDVLPGPVRDAEALEEALHQAIKRFLTNTEGAHDPRGYLQRDRRFMQQSLHALERGVDLPWSSWLSCGPKLKAAADDHVFHPQLRLDLLRAHDLMFSAAARGLERYAESKRAWGVVDFIDQERHALRLLERVDLRERLSDEIHLVLVDEVQDTSPLQLKIFRALARIGKRSIWVGDRKQSIYGFRGADATVLAEAIASDVDDVPPPLSASRRSRKPLVELSSKLFQAAFARHDPSVEAGPLTAVDPEDDVRLGPMLEWWDTEQLASEGKAALQVSVARGVAALCGAEGPQVRDRQSGALRRALPSDIAVLVRQNETARRVAAALSAVGVRTALRRKGLGKTVEARVLRAGLCLWLDGGDRLAAAEVARVLEPELTPAAWMTRLADGGAPLAPAVARVVAAAQAQRGAGVVVALDAVVDALGLLSWCAAMDDAEQRRANLSALRALAVRTVAAAQAQGRGATVAGFIATLQDLASGREAAEGDDRLGVVDAGGAVQVLTWHAAKGLEWPIVVLGELHHQPPQSVFGLHIVRDDDGTRWPRCWVTPYTFKQQKMSGGLPAALRQTPEAARLHDSTNQEELRLLYVAWTRARDRVVLCGTPEDFGSGPLRLLGVGSPRPRTHWAGMEFACAVRRLTDEPTPPAAPPERTDYAAPERSFDTSAFIQPSAVERAGRVVQEQVLGTPLLPLRVPDDEEATNLGRALHALFAVTAGAPPSAPALDPAQVLARFGVQGVLSPADAEEAVERLRRFLQGFGPDARVRTEVPLLHRLADGACVRGQIDLLVESGAQVAVLDHKTYVADAASSRQKAAGFAGQLLAYANGASAALGRPVDSLWIHMPIAARMFRVEVER